MKRGRRAKAARHGVRGILADRAEEAAGDAARAAGATASQTKITVSRRGNRASHAGSFPFPWMGWTARGQGPRRTLLWGEAYDYNIPETPERNEAYREAQNEGREARPAQARQTTSQRSHLRSRVRSDHRLEPQ